VEALQAKAKKKRRRKRKVANRKNQLSRIKKYNQRRILNS
jgi:hypothetical protein